jgi:RND family efflux transporter MFP subunit
MDSSHSLTNGPASARGVARWSAVVGVLAAAVVIWGIFASHRAGAKLQEAADAQAIVTVATIKPAQQQEEGVLSLPGTVQANYDAPIYARTNGYLKKWYVDIGTPVKTGQVLAEIDAPEVDQQLRQAQADLVNAEANQKIAGITSERWRGLRDTDSVSKQEADEKISLAATADAQVAAAQANLQRLRELSGFKKILSPFDGVVTARNTDVGQLISAGGTGPELFRIADTRKLRLYVRVPQTYAALMQPNLEAQVLFPDRPGMTFTAKLERTSSALDATSRTLLAQLIVDNSKNELLPGGYAEVDFKLPGSAEASTFKLPANVLLFRGDGTQVATVDAQNRVVLKPVTIGRDYGSDIEIVQGLTKEDNVVLSPPDSLTDRAEVRLSKPAENKEVAKL